MTRVLGTTARLSAPGLAGALGTAGVLAQIGYPLSSGTARSVLTVAVVVLLAACCVAHAVRTRGAGWAAVMVSITAGGGLLAEFVGTRTGVPFGDYVYTSNGALGPEWAGIPLIIGPAWTLGAYPAWCAARRLGLGRVATTAAAAWGLAAWDLYLDPQMVADGRWSWTTDASTLPGLPEIPLTNFAGWLLVAAVMATALTALGSVTGEPDTRHDAIPIALFCWTWLGSALAHAAFLGLPVSAGYGLVGMGVIGVPLVRVLLASRSGPVAVAPVPSTPTPDPVH